MKKFTITKKWVMKSVAVISFSLSVAMVQGQSCLYDSINYQTLSLADPVVCYGDSATIQIDSSETGVSYFLRNNSDNSVLSGPVSGTGNALSFTTDALTGNSMFNVYAKKDSTPNYAINLDGSNDYVSVPHDNSMNVTRLTIMGWFNFKSMGLFFLSAKGNETQEIHTDASGNIRFIPTPGVYLDTDSGVISTSGWVHIACVYNPIDTNYAIYVNGTPVKVTSNGPSSPSKLIASNTSELNIGRRNNGSYQLNGKIDQIVFLDDALDSAEVNYYMNSCFVEEAPNLVTGFHFNEGPGNESTSSMVSGMSLATLQNTDTSTVWESAALNCILCEKEIAAPVSVGVSKITLVSSGTDITCNGANDGKIASVATLGGYVPYTYSLDGITYQNSNLFENLGPNTYTMYTKDAYGCTAVNNSDQTINEPSSISLTAQLDSGISCYGSNDAEISVVSASGGTGTLKFRLGSSGSFNSQTVYSNLSSGSYAVWAQDENGCETNGGLITVNEPDSISVTAQKDADATCTTNSGEISVVSSSGGTGVLQFSIDNSSFSVSGNFNNLGAGTYTIYARDDNGCIGTDGPFTITAPSAPSISVQIDQQISCHDVNDGQVSVVSGSGGTGPYLYSLDNVSYGTAQSFSNLSEGTYNIYIRDAVGCKTSSSDMVISNPAAISLTSVAVEDISCNGANDGSVEVYNPTGGTGTLYYSMDSVTFDTNHVFDQKGQGTYSLYVKDDNGCAESYGPYTINEPAVLSVTAVLEQPITCHDDNDAMIRVDSVWGGTGVYTYQLYPASTFLATDSFENLSSGMYTVYVKDGNGCLDSSAAIEVINPAPLVLAAQTDQDISCHNANDAQISVANVSGGTAPYLYELGTVDSSGTFSGLSEGAYVMKVTDKNGCEDFSDTLIITNPDSVSFAVNGMKAACYGSNDGEIIITNATGGAAPLSFGLDSSNLAQVTVLTNLMPGSYSVYAKDANGCMSVSDTVLITEPDSLQASITTTNADCGLSNGTATIVLSGATPGYTLDWKGADSTALSAGNYTVMVTDGNSCQTFWKIEITNPNTPEVAVTATDVLCNGASDGTASLVITSGTGPYSINWYGEDSTALSVGDYVVTVTDALNCVVTDSFSVAEPDPIVLMASSTDETSVQNDGTITLSATGGSGAFEYSVDGTTYQSSGSFVGLAAGDYTVYAQDANACEATDQVLISAFVGMNDELEAMVIMYPNPSAGSVFIETEDFMNGSLQMLVSNELGQVVVDVRFLYANNRTHLELEPGLYFVTLQRTDSNGHLNATATQKLVIRK